MEHRENGWKWSVEETFSVKSWNAVLSGLWKSPGMSRWFIAPEERGEKKAVSILPWTEHQ